ncbi:uncharacterized protein JCM6883_003831 [Sporobolomyces salmoneus]|uniref:uncharacterized protein n=1 Tax=Sporobolomyces salmoneus TaxID=183962 RepID=UPI003175200E
MPPKASASAVPPINVEQYLKDASKNAREDEVGDGPEGNWEVAYVYAFIDRFTDLRKVEYGAPLKSVFDLERALLASSPPSRSQQRKAALAAANKNNGADAPGNGNGNGQDQERPHSSASSLSSLSDDEDTPTVQPMPSNPSISSAPPVLAADTPIPPPSETLVAIIECFKQNLVGIPEMNDYHGRKTWLTWLINFVGKRLGEKFFGGFRWETNLLRTRGLKPGQEEDKMFWYLRWEDKIHLFRQLVDFQLTNSTLIRERVQQGYDLGHQRNALRTQAANPLIVEPLGTTLSKRQVFHIDESARLYVASAIPTKSTNSVPPANSNWASLTSTSPGYKAFLLSLPEPAPAPGTVPGKPGPRKNKGPKPGSKEDPKREERLIRGKLEHGLEKLVKYEEAMAEIEVKERRVAARRADADARLARNISRTVNTSSRTTRQKPKTVNYANDGVGENGDEEIDELEESVAGGDYDETGEQTMGRGKRRKTATTNANEEDWETSSIASASTSGRRGSARNAARMGPTIPGERRSSRVQSKLKEEGYEVGSDEVDELDEDGGRHDQSEEMKDVVEAKEEEAEPESKVEEAENGKEEDGVKPEENGHAEEANGSKEVATEAKEEITEPVAKEEDNMEVEA